MSVVTALKKSRPQWPVVCMTDNKQHDEHQTLELLARERSCVC